MIAQLIPRLSAGKRCETDIDECADNPCQNYGRCRNLIGRFKCDCRDGFVGDRCQGDVDECASNPCSEEGSVECIEGINYYTCKCKPVSLCYKTFDVFK